MRTLSSWQRFLLSLSVGLSIYYLVLDLGGTVLGAWSLQWLLYATLVVLLVFVARRRSQVTADVRALVGLCLREWLLVSFALVCSLSLAATIFFSWWYTPMGLTLQGGNLHDSVWHVALMKELQLHMPALHPSSFESTLENYHYYYDLGGAALATATLLEPALLHFQIFPVLIALFLAAAAIGFTRSVSTNRSFSYWLLFFLYFGGNAGFVIPWFFPTKNWMESSFWVSQTFSMMINPQLLLSFALLLVLMAIPLWGDLVKKHRLFATALVIIAALAGIKIYAFLLATILLGLYLFYRLCTGSFKQAAIKLALLALVSLGMFVRFTDLSQQQLIFSPLWFVNTMVEAPDRLFVIDWKLREETYLAENAYVHYLVLKFKELMIFYMGNLGSRVVLIGLPLLLVLRWRRDKTSRGRHLYVSNMAATGLLISTTVPLLFIQSGVVWNTIQFWYYGLVFASVLAALTMSLLFEQLKKKRWLYWLFSSIVIAVTLPAWYQTYHAKFTTSDLIAQSILMVAKELRPEERVFICPEGVYANFIFKSALIRGLSGAHVYLADPVQLELVGLNGYAREQVLMAGYRDKSWMRETIEKAQISSVVCADDTWNEQMAELFTSLGVRHHRL